MLTEYPNRVGFSVKKKMLQDPRSIKFFIKKIYWVIFFARRLGEAVATGETPTSTLFCVKKEKYKNVYIFFFLFLLEGCKVVN